MRTPSRPHRRLALAGLAVLALALPACATKSGNGAGSLGNLNGTPTTAPTPPTGGSTGTPSPPSGTSTGTRATATHTTTGTGQSGPRIDEFVIVQQPTCPVIGTTDSPFSAPGQDVKLEWKTSGGVAKVALSVDNPTFFDSTGTGNYAEYSPSDNVDLGFSCDDLTKPQTTHTYTINTIGGGKSVAKTLTISAQTQP